MLNRLLAALLLAFAMSCSIAHAASLPAESKKCLPLSTWKALAAQNSGVLEKNPLSAFKLDFAKRLYALMPPASPAPKADEALEIDFEDGSGIILFVSHGVICKSIGMPSSLHKKFDDVKEPVPGELHL